jgi:hypothetical protein
MRPALDLKMWLKLVEQWQGNLLLLLLMRSQMLVVMPPFASRARTSHLQLQLLCRQVLHPFQSRAGWLKAALP